MWAQLQAPLLTGIIAALVTTLGLFAVARYTAWSERYSSIFGLAAGGMLLTLTLLHIAPSALSRSDLALAWMLTGFAGGCLLHIGASHLFGDPEQLASRHAQAITPVIAIGIHSLLDGVIYAVTFASSTQSGIYAALSLILHEFPEGVIAFIILRRNDVSARLAFLFAFLAAAATTPLGVLLSGPFIYGLGEELIGNLFAISAGLLVFVATGPLMAPLRKDTSPRNFLTVGAGALVAFCILFFPFWGSAEHHHGRHSHTPKWVAVSR